MAFDLGGRRAARRLGRALVLGKAGRRSEHPKLRNIRSFEMRNPFDLGTVLQLAGFIALILLLAKLVAAQAGNAGLFLLAAISGIANVDALTLSMARLSGVQVAAVDAATAILVAASVNTASKAAIAAFVGGSRLGSIVGGVSVLAIGALGLTYMLRWIRKGRELMRRSRRSRSIGSWRRRCASTSTGSSTLRPTRTTPRSTTSSRALQASGSIPSRSEPCGP